jgi:3-oxoadipate enol-lactonase
MPFVVANGVRLHVQRMAAKAVAPGAPSPTAVFIHGLGTDSLASFYFTVAPAVSAAGIDVVAYDLRGHGRSDRPRDGYTVADSVDDLTALLDALDVTVPVHLVGNSYGGTVAFSFAQRHPQRVLSLLVIESEPATPTWAAKISELLDRGARELVLQESFDWIAERHGKHVARLGRAYGHLLATTTMRADVPRGPLLTREEIGSIHHPVLAIFGGESHVLHAAQVLPTVLPRCEITVIPGQEHTVLAKAPKAVREHTLAWIARHHPVGAA